MKTFWAKNKVFILGLLGAIVYAIMGIESTPDLSWKQFLMPTILAVGSFMANNLRGQAQSIVGIFITVIAGYFTKGDQTTQQFLQWVVVQVGVLFFGFTGAPAKPITYEHNETIVEAKQIPAVDQVPSPPLKTEPPSDAVLK